MHIDTKKKERDILECLGSTMLVIADKGTNEEVDKVLTGKMTEVGPQYTKQAAELFSKLTYAAGINLPPESIVLFKKDDKFYCCQLTSTGIDDPLNGIGDTMGEAMDDHKEKLTALLGAANEQKG